MEKMDLSTSSRILLLRVSYWTGAIADAIVGIRMLIPEVMGEAVFSYAMGTSAALMFGWTALLLWADRRPVQRRGVLLLTIFPVITGLMLAAVWPVVDGVFPVSRMIPIWVLGSTLMLLLGISCYMARSLDGDMNQLGSE
jgi:hypothetical protein